MAAKFSESLSVVSALANAGLRAVAPASIRPDSVTLAVPAGRLLLADDPGEHTGLVEGFRVLARLGVQGGMDMPAQAGTPAGAPLMLADSQHHKRDVYHPLVLHLHLAAFLSRYESLPRQHWSVCEDALPAAVAPCRTAEAYTDAPPPRERVALTLWHALCLVEQAMLVQRDADLELLDSVVHQITSRPGRDGSLHPPPDDEALDFWTYRELTGLHALSMLAVRRRNAAWSARVKQIVEHHAANTQPDNVTTQPWAAFAFIWTGRREFAEQQMHDAATGTPDGTPPPLPALLLADAAAALGLFG